MAAKIDGYDYESFQKRFNQITKESQNKAAAKLDIDPPKLTNMLKGNTPVTMKVLYAISNTYGCSLDYLIGTDTVTPKTTNNTGDFTDFISHLLFLYETESCRISDIETPDGMKKALVFNNNSIQNFLTQLKDVIGNAKRALPKESYDVLYDAWKKDRLIDGKKKLKIYDYQSKEEFSCHVMEKFEYINDVYFKGYNPADIPKLSDLEFDVLLQLDKECAMQYRRIMRDEE